MLFSPQLRARLRQALTALLPLTGMAIGAPAGAAVMISQVYGGGGNSGAPLNNDFVELHNSGTAPVNITGWSLQYASSAGSTWGDDGLLQMNGLCSNVVMSSRCHGSRGHSACLMLHIAGIAIRSFSCPTAPMR